ncbi:MAG: sirohydrochlorin cobaltochelatase [Desulfonauticus sp.]|nr:sirohydrochlorin cobaltochelatase [Desulfonauticus sp.]
MRVRQVLWLSVFFVLFNVNLVLASGHKQKVAIVLASFGTTYPQTLDCILNIQNKIAQTFPKAKVKIAFTSNIIRKIWHKRQNDPVWTKNKRVPKEILYVKGPLATIADLQDEGYKTIIVQPTHVFAGEEFIDLCSYIRGLNSIKTIKPKYMPFKKLVISRPLTGMWGIQHDYHKDLEQVAKALAQDVALAKGKKAALVYMGHGNEFFSTGIYIEFQQVMRRMYPDTKIYVGTVEGFPAFDDVLNALVHGQIKRVVLKPFMIVAGDHARNDMAGDEPGSWKNRLEAKGITVFPVIQGLGENPQIVQLFISHLKDTLKDYHINLY